MCCPGSSPVVEVVIQFFPSEHMVPGRDDIGAAHEQLLTEVRSDAVADRRVLSVDDAEVHALGPAECREDGTNERDAGLPYDVSDCKYSYHNTLPVPIGDKKGLFKNPLKRPFRSLFISRSPLRGSP